MSLQMARPDLACHNRAMRESFPEVVRGIREILGAKLVAYIGGVKETRAVRKWAEGTRTPSSETERRVRLAYGIAMCIDQDDRLGRETAQAWFQGLNPLLDDVSPARLIREGDVDTDGPTIITAERNLLANG
jgi:hypothetical protein